MDCTLPAYPDVDECTLYVDNCDANATCTDTIGSFQCACYSGHTGSGVTCSGKTSVINVHATATL